MYKVFLVDDEIVVREGIRSNFPWEETEFALSGEAPDGEIALSMLQDIKPDILITDIRMPFMDGLALCRAVTRTMPWMYVIILSGYDDFSYAREAISLGVKEYLLKPVSGQELRQVLERIALRIREDKRQQANIKLLKEQFASSSRYLREKLLLDLMDGADADTIMERARTLQLNLFAKRYAIMLIRAVSGFEDRDEVLTARGIMQRLVNNSGQTAHLCETAEGFALLVLGDSDADLEERAYAFAQAAQYDVERNTRLRLLVSISTATDTLSAIPSVFREVRTMMDGLIAARRGNGARRIISAQDAIQDTGFELLNLDATPIAEQLTYASIRDVDAILEHYQKALGASAAQSLMLANYMFVDILLAASRSIRENGGVPQEVIPNACRAQAQSAGLLAPEELIPMARYMLERTIVFRDAQGSSRYGEVIRKAKAFIAERYADSNLTLKDVAARVMLSNNHFCTVFSQETGETFTEYLTGVRLTHARELLTATSMRTAEIAYAVGYNDPHYFSYLFRKNTGMSPRDFRKDEKVID